MLTQNFLSNKCGEIRVNRWLITMKNSHLIHFRSIHCHRLAVSSLFHASSTPEVENLDRNFSSIASFPDFPFEPTSFLLTIAIWCWILCRFEVYLIKLWGKIIRLSWGRNKNRKVFSRFFPRRHRRRRRRTRKIGADEKLWRWSGPSDKVWWRTLLLFVCRCTIWISIFISIKRRKNEKGTAETLRMGNEPYVQTVFVSRVIHIFSAS